MNVWVSPATYNFETDFNVIVEETLQSDLVESMNFGVQYATQFSKDRLPPFLTMAASILSMQRTSKNNLKYNFLDYKSEQNWIINSIEENRNIGFKGKKSLSSAKQFLNSLNIQKLLDAKTFNEVEYKRYKKKYDSNESTPKEEWFDCQRTAIELFYGEAINYDLLEFDNKGKLRKQIRMLETLGRKPKLDNQTINTKIEMQRARVKLQTIYDRKSAASLLYVIFNMTPVFENDKFDPTVIFTSADLNEFAKYCKQFNTFIETQLDLKIRKDVEQKSVQQLWSFLKIVGMKNDKSIKPTKVGGQKVYRYKIDERSFSKLAEIIKRREIIDPDTGKPTIRNGWAFVNKHYGFEYTPNELDYLIGY